MVVRDTGRDAGGAEVEDEDAVGVDLGVVEADGRGQAYAKLLQRAVAVNGAAARLADAADGIGVPSGACGRLEAEAVVRRIVKYIDGLRPAQSFKGHAAERELALRAKRNINARGARVNIATRADDPVRFHTTHIPSFEMNVAYTSVRVKCATHHSRVSCLGF